MSGTVLGDGTLNQQGGPIEARGGVAVAEPEKSFADSAREAFVDFSSTLSPLYSLVPNLGSIELKDASGVSFSVDDYRNQKTGKISSIGIETDRLIDYGLIYYQITEDPLTTVYKDETTGVWLHGEEALKATKEKLEELLAPIKAAREKPLTPDVG